MNRYARWAFAFAVLPLAACADNKPAPTPVSPALPPVAANDVSFVSAAVQGDMAEIQEAQLALSITKSPRIKAFANKMIADHGPADDQLKQIAAAKGITIPTTVTDLQSQEMATLKTETGRTFDRGYIDTQVKDHQAMVEVYTNESNSSTDVDLKKYATDTLPVVQNHLAMAQKLTMGGHAMHHGMRHHMTKTTN